MRLALAVLLAALACSRPAAAVVLGGGLTDTDCTVAFGGVDATDGDSGVVCVDGDPSCDADATADGTCHFVASLCAHVAARGCSGRAINSVAVAGIPFDVPGLAGGRACGEVRELAVDAGSARGATAIARDGGALRDVDYLNLCCRHGAGRLEAVRCALAVPLTAAGCGKGGVPAGVATPYAKARRLIEEAASDPTRAAALEHQARRALGRALARARALARRNACGNALGLMMTHARATLRAATSD